jgi:hypothetical protein
MLIIKNCFKKRLKEELKSLQQKFNAGQELSLKYLPNEVRYSQFGNILSVEVDGNGILIYDDKLEKAITPLIMNL